MGVEKKWPIASIRRWIEVERMTQRDVGRRLGCRGSQV